MDPTRGELSDHERRALDDLRARDQLDVLLHVSRVLAEQDDSDPTRGLPDIIVPAIGDWCSVDLLDGPDLRRVAARHVNGDHTDLEAQLRVDHPGWLTGATAVVRTRASVLVFDVREPSGAGVDPHVEVLAGLGLVSVAMVPIQTPDRIFGVLTVGTGPGRRGHRPSDVAPLEELARWVALAIERADVQDVLLNARQQGAELEGARRIAHDFGNLLMRIVGFAELAERRVLAGESALEELAEIRTAAEAAVRLSRAPVAVDDGDDSPAVADACVVVDGLSPTLRALAGGSDLRIDAAATAPVPLQASAVEHILRNLVANAAHAVEERPGASTITVSIGPADGRPDHTEIRVADDGIGMEPHLLAVCRVDGFTTRGRKGGTGRGLTMVAWLVEEAGGVLEVFTEPGVGTTVTAVLPHPA